MSADPGMAYLNGLLDEMFLLELRRGYRRCLDERYEAQSAAASAEAQERYETGVIEEARSIVAGESETVPTVEHLRVLIVWLDGAMSAPEEENGEAPF